MTVTELIKLLKKQDKKSFVGIQWTDGEEIVAYADDVLFASGTKESVKVIGAGNRFKDIFLMTGEEPIFPIRDLLESLNTCEAKAEVAVKIGHGADEAVGYIVSGEKADDDLFVLVAEQRDSITLKGN